MRKSKRKTPQHERSESADIVVKLKPFFGIKPGAYLTVIYTLLLLFIIFLVFFYPGLRNRGTFVRFDTFPPGAVILIDGEYGGSTPCELLVKKGKIRITVEKPFYRTIEIQDSFGGRIFATLFFRPKKIISLNLNVQDPDALISYALKDFSANPDIPEIMKETVLAVYERPEAEVKQKLSVFLDNSKYFINDSYKLKELVFSHFILSSDAMVLSPYALLDVVQKFIQLKELYDNFPFWLILVLPEMSASQLVDTEWFLRFLDRYKVVFENRFAFPSQPMVVINPTQQNVGQELTQPEQRSAFGLSRSEIAGLSFKQIPAGVLIQGSLASGSNPTMLMPHPVLLRSFLMTETEISKKYFQSFLNEVPQWRKTNLNKLLAAGLVSENYLKDWQDNTYPAGEDEYPATNLSYYAAEAFTRWFSGKISLPGYSARLPFEAEWEWAARGGLVGKPYPTGGDIGNALFFKNGILGPDSVGHSEPNGYGLRDMSGNVWEWVEDWHSPVKYLFSSWTASKNDIYVEQSIPMGAEKVVRGGSWTNEKELVTLAVRGSQPPDWCTPYLGFRVVLSRF